MRNSNPEAMNRNGRWWTVAGIVIIAALFCGGTALAQVAEET
jgi:hypothetical protein